MMRYHARRPEIDVKSGLADDQLAKVSDPQHRFNLVLAHYLAGAMSLGITAPTGSRVTLEATLSGTGTWAITGTKAVTVSAINPATTSLRTHWSSP